MNRHTKRGGWPYSQPPNVPFTINRASPQAKGLVAWWPTLGSQGANVLRDFSGYGNDGAFKGVGEPAWVTDAFFGATLDFDSDYVDFGTQTIPADISISAFVYPHTLAADTYYAIVSYANDSSGSCELSFFGTSLRYFVRSINGYRYWDPIGFTAAINTRYHVTVVQSGVTGTPTFYVDGVNYGASVVASLGTPVRETVPLAIGQRGNMPAQYFDGLFGSGCLHKRALIPTEVYQLYANPWELYAPLVRWWPGYVAAGGITVAPDATTAVASKADPSVVLGSLAIGPSAVDAVASKADPTVIVRTVIALVYITPAARSRTITPAARSVDLTVEERNAT